MKKVYIIAASIVCFASVHGAENSITLYEAEKMVKGGKAILIKLPPEMTIDTIKNSDENISELDNNKISDLNISSTPKPIPVAANEVKPTLPVASIITQQIPTASASVVVASEDGISIAMPTTLSTLLEKLSKVTHEVYFCDDEINIPAANIKITSLSHLNKYLAQVSVYHIEIVKESTDSTIPKVLKVLKGTK